MAQTQTKPTGASLIKRDVVEGVSTRVSALVADGDLVIPENYVLGNALKAAWLILQETEDMNHKLALEVCTQASVANALLDMVIQGLNPEFSQCYFIVYGKTLVCQRSYFGTVAILRRIYGAETTIEAEVIYESDTFEYEIEGARRKITKHAQVFGNIDNDKIVGAYAIIEIQGRKPHVEIMTIGKIRLAWEQGKARGNSPAHKKFPDQMAKKTVIGRACKLFINSADDSYLVRAVRRQSELATVGEMAEERQLKANVTPIGLPAAEVEVIESEQDGRSPERVRADRNAELLDFADGLQVPIEVIIKEVTGEAIPVLELSAQDFDAVKDELLKEQQRQLKSADKP